MEFPSSAYPRIPELPAAALTRAGWIRSAEGQAAYYYLRSVPFLATIVRFRFAMQMKGIHPLNVTVRFGNPFLVTLYTTALLIIGWVIGAHWSDTFVAGWMLLLATILLLLHDAVVAILFALAAAKVATAGQKG